MAIPSTFLSCFFLIYKDDVTAELWHYLLCQSPVSFKISDYGGNLAQGTKSRG